MKIIQPSGVPTDKQTITDEKGLLQTINNFVKIAEVVLPERTGFFTLASGLNLEADKIYKILFALRNAGSSNNSFYLRVNNNTSLSYNWSHIIGSSSGVSYSGSGGTNGLLFATVSILNICMGEIIMQSCNVGGAYKIGVIGRYTADGIVGVLGGSITYTNVNSIQILDSLNGYIEAGSKFYLFKLAHL